MQMVFHCYLVAWYEGLPKAAPPLCWRDLIFSAQRCTGSLLLIHLAGGWFALRQAGQSTDLWVESPALLGRQSVWANDRAQKTEAVELWLADIAAGFCKLSYSQTWLTKGVEWLKQEWIYWSCCCDENDTHKLFLQEGEHTAGISNFLCDVKQRWTK